MFIIKFKKIVINTYIFSILLIKLGHYKKFNLIILLKIDKNFKINMDYYYSIIQFFIFFENDNS